MVSYTDNLEGFPTLTRQDKVMEILHLREGFLTHTFNNYFIFFIFDRPTVGKGLVKNLPSRESTEHGLESSTFQSKCLRSHFLECK